MTIPVRKFPICPIEVFFACISSAAGLFLYIWKEKCSEEIGNFHISSNIRDFYGRKR
jgi:hypothetical protein